MQKKEYFIHVKKQENGKQTRHYLKPIFGYVDQVLEVGFYIDDWGVFTATDLLTGNALITGCGMDLDYHLDVFYSTCAENIDKIRSSYWYNDAVKVFNILKAADAPMTERKINNIILKMS
jgi:hypothetical protein